MYPRFSHFVSLWLAATLLTFSGAARADQIIMKNGDMISGKVVKVDEKEVTINPEYTGKFAVKRNAVASITTEGTLEVELADGRLVTAQFAGLEDGAQVLVIEEHPEPVDVGDVYKAAPPQKFYARESHAEGMFTINEGNTNSRSAIVNFDTRLRLGDHRQYAKIIGRRDENDNKTTKRQTRISYEYDWLFRRNWYLGATAYYERDPIRDLSHRFTFGALLGHDLWDTGNSFLTIKAGAGYTDENLADVTRDGMVGLWELDFRQKFGKSKVELVHDHAMTYQHYGDNNVIVRSNTGLRLDVLWKIYATASYRFNYESEPAPGRFSKDSTLAFGLGAKF